MNRHSLVLTVSLLGTLTLGVHGARAAEVPDYIAAAVADGARPDADKERDASRKPAESLQFAGVKPGEQIAEFFPGGGYFTRIFSKAVGGRGHVYALVPERPANAPADMPDMSLKAKAIAADPVIPM